ncbi:MAG: peptide chain release factor N(5)-glutamine methyltransferase [Bacteroidota bacterium]|nr:peptide chain release factor N(5)-glutamine methyltransferase [Bacteroidota bacterium]
MTLREDFSRALSDYYPKDEIDTFFFMILEKIANCTKSDYILNPNIGLNPEQICFFEQSIAQLKQYQPIQYILGYAYFYDSKFVVNPNVLIPRPETEELVDWIVQTHQHKRQLRILDIGTGSGAIAISLSKKLDAKVFAFDISEEALEVSQRNADYNNCFVHWIKFDILNDIWKGESFDVIVSNPPYVRECEKEQMQPNVLNYEPHLALFVPDQDPLKYYKSIAQFAATHLKKDGYLFLEINQYLASETLDVVQKHFSECILKKDLFDNYRMILATNTSGPTL